VSWLLWAGLLACRPRCEPEAPCDFQGGSYQVVRAPQSTERAVLFLHGRQAGGDGVRRRTDVAAFHDRGLHVVFPTAPKGDWRVARGHRRARRDAWWLADLADELQRTGVARELFVAGHSVGGSMTWYTACYEGDRFVAFGPSSGGFWEPVPPDCPAGPVHLRHSHGRIDTFVPLEGRALRRADIAQADILEGLQRWRAHDGCGDEVTVSAEGPYTCEHAVGCVGEVQLCLYEGRHPKPDGWEGYLADWFASF